MNYPVREYHLRPSSRRSSPSRAKDYGGDNGTAKQIYANVWQPPTSGRSTPSPAVRRALQVLDESYKQQGNKVRGNNDQLPSFCRGRSTTPSKSRPVSPIRRFLRDSRSPVAREPTTPPRILEIERDNLQDALGDSESRRNVLLRKLAETQRTMEIQNDVVKKGEIEIQESKAAAKLLHQLQDELETKVQFLEKERDSLLNRQLQDAEEKEILRREADNFHREMKRLKRELDEVEADNDEGIREINRVKENARDMQESNKKLLEKKSVLSDKVTELQELFFASKQRSEALEKEKLRAIDDLRCIQDSQQAIINRNTELNERLNVAENNVVRLRNKLDEMEMAYQSCKHDKEIHKEKSSKQGYKLAEMQTTQKDLQSDLDRSNRYINELERTLESVKEMNQKLKENKVKLEDNLTNLHADLAKSRLEFSKSSEENTRLKEENEATKKAQRDLAANLAEARHQLSMRDEELAQAQAYRKSEVQKMGLLQTQKNQLDVEREELEVRFTSVQQDHEDLKIRIEEDCRKNAQRSRELTVERDRLSAKHQEAELRLERLNLELTATVEHDQSQLDHWRETCTKLTSLIEERDREQRESVARLIVAEEDTERSEAKAKALEKELSVMQELRAELAGLTNENKNLAQEIKENQQMISVLEMERDVLSKSPTKSSDNDLLSAEVKKLQSELKRALDKLTSSESDKSQALQQEAQRKGLETLEADLKRAQESNKLLDDRLSQVKKEAETLHGLMEARTDTHEREVRKLERERERLESRIRSLEDEARVLRSSLTSSARSPRQYADGELRNLRVEVTRLKRELEENEQTYLVTKGQLVVAQNARRSADNRLAAFEAQKGNAGIEKSPTQRNRPDTNADVSMLQVEVDAKKARLEATEAECAILRSRVAELSEVRRKLENTIKVLRKQNKELKESFQKSDEDSLKSEENQVSAVIELASVRCDLQRALQDIETKDRELDEMRKSLASAQKQEQRARQERDELKGKTIVMESIHDSSGELRKELENVQMEKRDLQKQLNTYIKSKPSQTPHSSLSLSGELDREMEKQYKTVYERNKWLESRISSLIREIELLRDQNSLLTEEKKAAERQSDAMEGELKSVTLSSKSTRQQREIEQIHLQNSNAEKMQQVLELQRELREKNQLLQVMSKQLASQKKSDKNKISSFMKKFRKSSGSIGLSSSHERGHLQVSATEPILSTSDASPGLALLPSAFSAQTLTEPGYNTVPLIGKSSREKKSGDPKRPRSTSGDMSRSFQVNSNAELEEARPRSRSYQPRDHEVPEFPGTAKGLSPSPTHPSSARRVDHRELLVDPYPDYISDTGEPIRRSPETVVTLPELLRKKKDYSSRPDAAEGSSSDESRSDDGKHADLSFMDTSDPSKRARSDMDRKRSYSTDGQTIFGERRMPSSRHEETGDLEDSDKEAQAASPTKQSRRSSDLMPKGLPPKPTAAPVFATPTPSSHILSPPSARSRSVRINLTEYEEGSGPRESIRPSPGSPLPTPTPTSGSPTKSKSSKVPQADDM